MSFWGSQAKSRIKFSQSSLLTVRTDNGKFNNVKVQTKCFFVIAEFERAAKIRKIAVYRFLISLPVPEL